MKFAEAINNEHLEEFFAQNNAMLSSAAEDRNENDPEDYVAPNEYDFDPYEIEKLNMEVSRKRIDTHIEFQNSPRMKSKLTS